MKDLSAEIEAQQRFERLFANNPALMALSTLPDRRFVEVKKDPAGEAIDGLDEAVAGFTEVTAELKTIAASLDTIIGRVERGEGTLGRLINEEDAHDEFLAAVKEVRELVEEIRSNPKNFVKFSLF